MASALAGLLMISVLVAWSPRYWPVALLHTGLFSLGAVWIARNKLQLERSWRTGLIAGAMLLAGVWGLVQLALGTSVYRFQTIHATLYWSANAVAMLLGWQLLGERTARRRFFAGLVYFAGAIAVIGIVQYFASPYAVYGLFPLSQHTKAVGPFVYRNQFAAFVELVLPIVIYRAIQERRQRGAMAMIAAILLAAVVATASRAGTLLVASEVFVVFGIAWCRRMVASRSVAIIFGQVIALAVVFTLVVGFHDVWSRFQETNPYALRGKLTYSTLMMIRTRPALGYGLGTWQTVYPEFASFDNSLFANEAHNDWAQWTAEGGLEFGLALAVVALGASALAWRKVWGIGITFVFLHSLIDYPMREPVVGAILFVLAGALVGDTGKKNS